MKRGDGPHLCHGLSVVNTYTKVISGSKSVAVVVKTWMAIPITIAKGIKVTQVVAANAVSQVEVVPRTLEKLDDVQGSQQIKMAVERRREVLFQQLNLCGLEGWSEGNQVVTHALLAEYYDIFSLEPGQVGCTNLGKHKIRVVDDEPFKEQFWRISPPMVDEVQAHVKDMLEVGTVCPSQSPWCNAVVLVCRKEEGLHFCIDFHKLNARTMKDSYLLPQIQEPIESLVRAGCISCLDLKAGFWQIAMDKASKQYTAFTMVDLGFFKCECMSFRMCNAPAMFQGLMQNCLGELSLTYCLIYLDHMIVFLKMEEEHLQHLHVVSDHFQEHNPRLKPTKCKIFWNEINYLAQHVSREDVRSSKDNLTAVADFTLP